jgi:chemotaxis protein MotA
LGGTFGATLINYPIRDIIRVLKVTQNAFFVKDEDYFQLIPQMVQYSKKARKEGTLVLDNVLKDIDDPFYYEGLRMIVDGISKDTVEQILRNEIDFMVARHRGGISIFNAMGQYAPAFGMIGTLIGLIFMLGTLNDPSQIASSMAIALVTTFYGAILSNIIFLPIAGKLKEKSQTEITKKEMILTGIISIQSGEIPRMVEQRMISFLPTEYRKIYIEKNMRK